MSDALHARTRDDEREWRDHDADPDSTAKTETAEQSEETDEQFECPE